MAINLSKIKGREILILVVMLAISVALISNADYFQRPNNGDGWRVLRSAQVVVPDDYHVKTPFSRYYYFKKLGEIKTPDLVPMSSTALVVEFISFGERAVKFEQFDFRLVTLLFYSIYLVGVLKILSNIRFFYAMPMLLVLINPYILAYFNSPYEESLSIALCPILSFLLVTNVASNTVTARAAELIFASSKIQFAPAVLLGIGDLKWRNNFLYLIMSAMLIGVVVLKANKFSVPNSYNRYFDGLSYSMSEVSDWPANEFISRREIANAMTAKAEIVFPLESNEIKQYWGSSYWPTGDRINPVESQNIAKNVGGWFWKTILFNPKYISRILTEPFLTEFKADYRMDYIFLSATSNKWLDAYSFFTRNFGIVFMMTSVVGLFFSIKNENKKQMLLIACLFIYPLFVVYGDGYYEFEKHLFPILVFGIIFSMYLSLTSLFPIDNKLRAATSPPVGISV